MFLSCTGDMGNWRNLMTGNATLSSICDEVLKIPSV
jgi:hypothetical protein